MPIQEGTATPGEGSLEVLLPGQVKRFDKGLLSPASKNEPFAAVTEESCYSARRVIKEISV